MRLYLLSLTCLVFSAAPVLAADSLSMIEPALEEAQMGSEIDWPEIINDITRSFVMPLAPAAVMVEQVRPAAIDQTTEEVKPVAEKAPKAPVEKNVEKKAEKQDEKQVPEETASYNLHSGDTVRIGVFGDKDVSGTYNISKEGVISLALIGEVQAAGKTTETLKKELAEKLGDGFFVNPQVTVEITEYRPFSIMGEVKNPGRYPYAEDMTILNAIATGGGYTGKDNAVSTPVRLQRENEKGLFTYHSVPTDIKVRPGDVIIIGTDAP